MGIALQFRSGVALVSKRLALLAAGLLLLPLAGCGPKNPTQPTDAAEDNAVAGLTKLGARVVRDEKTPPSRSIEVDLGGTNVTDAGLKELAALKHLQTLRLNTQVTDAGLKELAGLKGLQTLSLLGATKVTDAGLKELAPMQGLKTLDLDGTKVTDAGLKELAALKSLERAGTPSIIDATSDEDSDLSWEWMQNEFCRRANRS